MRISKKNQLIESETTSLPLDGEIWVNEFSEKSAQIFRQQVQHHFSAYGPEKPIIIYIDSYGGCADALAVMLETMDETPATFITVAVGKAMSAGAILLSHGDCRFSGRHARLMVHEVIGGAFGNARTVKNDTHEMDRINKYFMTLLATNCCMDNYEQLKQKFRDKDADEIWMSAEEGLAFGLIDHIGMPKLVPVEQWQCINTPEKPPLARQKPKQEQPVDKAKKTKPVDKDRVKKRKR